MCPRCGAVHDKEMAEMFERIPFTAWWYYQGSNPNMYVFDKRGIPRRQDSPHLDARRVTFKLPADVLTDRWTQVGAERKKWRSSNQGGRIAMEYRKKFQASKREAYRLENYKG